jgi:hypothetical protein
VEFRLLIDAEVLNYLQNFKASQRQRVMEHILTLRLYPKNASKFKYHDADGRSLDVSVFEEFEISYWIDEADRHIKVLSIEADE